MKENNLRLLVIGSGGREHAIVKQVLKSPRVAKVYCAPGNAGMLRDCECINMPVQNSPMIADFVKKQNIDLTIVGPELPLTLGLVDEFEKDGLKIFGPDKKASILEGSKIFTKEFCEKYNIPTASFRTFDSIDLAKQYIRQRKFPLVIKADGLASGKGVVIARDIKQADKTIQDMLLYEKYGDAGRKIVIEDFLEGQEASFIIITDGMNFISFPASQDHKAAFDNDTGPNTGGMGAYAPAALLTKELQDEAIRLIIKPTLQGMIQEGRPYRGFLYAGLMILPDGRLSLLEYNCRLGDPEAEVILPLLKTDFVSLIEASLENKLQDVDVEFENASAVCVVLASAGYPGAYKIGEPISGLDKIIDPAVMVVHAGTKKLNNNFATNGGRVLVVCAKADDLSSAIEKVYQNVSLIHWQGMHYRKDIGKKGL